MTTSENSGPVPEKVNSDKVSDSQLASASGTETDDDDEKMPLLDKFTLLFALPSFLISLIVHVILTAVAALIVFAGPQVVQVSLEASNSESVSVDEEEINLDSLELSDVVVEATDLSEPMDQVLESPSEIPIDVPTPMDMAPMVTPLTEGMPGLVGTDLSAAGATAGGGFSHRSSEAREQMAKNNGATAASEAAVELGLKWIAEHQLPDGGWDLNHQLGGGRFRQSPNPGEPGARIGATGLAILPFLGKGYTHQEGKYQRTVRDGLAFLIKSMRDEGAAGGSLRDERGTMYSHAIGAICLCEAHGMTKDPKLYPPANAAIKYIIYAQDPVGGGWRYQPQQAGDTSAVGWQLMALKSAQMMNLNAPRRVFDRTTQFLNYVQGDGGAKYGYDVPNPEGGGPGTTAVGVLSRMYLGWNKENPTLERAVQQISDRGPDTRVNADGGEGTESNMYYNYYATQIMRHYGDEPWEKWNVEMRDFLVKTQGKEGNAAGSWFFQNGHASEVGGRLYTTSMAVMTLEVYYRHLPLYKNESIEEEFPLD